MDVIVTAFVPVFVKVTGRVFDEPSGVFGKLSGEGAGESSSDEPSPVSVALCGLLGSLSVNVIVPVRFPVWVGTYVTQMLHEAVQVPSALCAFSTDPGAQ